MVSHSGDAGNSSGDEETEATTPQCPPSPSPVPDTLPSDGAAGAGGSPDAAEEAIPLEQAGEQQQPSDKSSVLDHVIDDFSLPSAGIRFRAGGKGMKIYEHPNGQLVLEEQMSASSMDDDEEQPSSSGGDAVDDKRKKERKGGILVRSINHTSYAFSFLRTAYSLIAVFVGGFLFILGLCILLFLFIDVATKSGATTTGNVEVVALLSVLLSVPIFVYSLAMGMTLGGAFVADTFYGHPFLRSFGMGVATTDWIAFVLYLGAPAIAFIVTLFLKKDNWWEIGLLTWFASILIFWCLFSTGVLFFELYLFFRMMDLDEQDTLSENTVSWKAKVFYYLKLARKGALKTMKFRLSGTRKEFLHMHTGYRRQPTLVEDNIKCCKGIFSQGLYSLFATQGWNKCFEPMDEERRIRTLDETLGRTAYITRQSWSLEKLFCRKGGMSAAIPITQGESALTESQVNSNIACNILGNIIIVLFLWSIIVWVELPTSVSGMVVFLAVIYFIVVGYRTLPLCGIMSDIRNDDSTSLYRYWIMYQLSEPKDQFVWMIILIQLIFFWILPLAYLCTIKNAPQACLFAFFGLFSALRHWFNPRVLLESDNKKDYLKDTLEVKTREDKKEWKRKSLLYDLVALGGDRARAFWMWVYIIFVIFCVMIVLASGVNLSKQKDVNETDEGYVDAMSLVGGYSYTTQELLPYPTCRLKKGFGGHEIQLADFAFLAKLAYSTDSQATKLLDKWFGLDSYTATNDVAGIEEFKKSSYFIDYGFGDSSVSYKLVTFDEINAAVVTIRGTAEIWDWMANAQLWMGATLFQGLRWLLPVSSIFTPILRHMVYIVTQLQSDSINKVAYYRETNGFVEWLKQEKGFGVVVTGHSLGGGLAIITGASTSTSAVAISGPNAMLSRDSFITPLTVESLDTYTFNVIPDRDPVPKVDDVARLYSKINCTSAANNPVSCHDSTRSICEIQYTCGSEDRPTICECFFDYDYPEPAPITTNQTNTSQTSPRTTFVGECLAICDAYGVESSKKCSRWKQKAQKLGVVI